MARAARRARDGVQMAARWLTQSGGGLPFFLRRKGDVMRCMTEFFPRDGKKLTRGGLCVRCTFATWWPVSTASGLEKIGDGVADDKVTGKR